MGLATPICKMDKPRAMPVLPWSASGNLPTFADPISWAAVSSSPAVSTEWSKEHRPHALCRCAVLDPNSVVKNQIHGYI